MNLKSLLRIKNEADPILVRFGIYVMIIIINIMAAPVCQEQTQRYPAESNLKRCIAY